MHATFHMIHTLQLQCEEHAHTHACTHSYDTYLAASDRGVIATGPLCAADALSLIPIACVCMYVCMYACMHACMHAYDRSLQVLRVSQVPCL
jgi:hypothetical protein